MLKVQIFDKQEKKMIDFDEVSENYSLMELQFEENEFYSHPLRNTGLKTKEGKEIYENYIVKITSGPFAFVGVIKYNVAGFDLAEKDETGNLKFSGIIPKLILSKEEFEIEILGDIYQNEDLL